MQVQLCPSEEQNIYPFYFFLYLYFPTLLFALFWVFFSFLSFFFFFLLFFLFVLVLRFIIIHLFWLNSFWVFVSFLLILFFFFLFLILLFVIFFLFLNFVNIEFSKLPDECQNCFKSIGTAVNWKYMLKCLYLGIIKNNISTVELSQNLVLLSCLILVVMVKV